MKEITIISGKGGTGKTTVTAALASVVKNAVFCDNDVDAADLHLIFNPEINESHNFSSGYKATIKPELCTNCGKCEQLCRFNAIHLSSQGHYNINHMQCEGCRLCERICPSNAIYSELNLNNSWYVSTTRFGTLVHAKMGPGEENSGKLVSQIRKRSRELALEQGAKYIINDGPPGIGCAAISSLSGTDAALIVIEPTKSGLHDAERLVNLIQSFNIDAFAIVNKFDINRDFTHLIVKYLAKLNIEVLGLLPFDNTIVNAMIEEKTAIEYNSNSNTAKQIIKIWERLQYKLQKQNNKVTVGANNIAQT